MMTRRLRTAARLLVPGLLASALLAVPTIAVAQSGVSLTLTDGRVTLKAENASLRQILAEWQRLGQVKIVGIDKLPAGQPLTLTLTDVPERQALDIVLRALPGYLVVNRAEPVATLSRYDRLLLMPRATTAVSTAASGPAPAAASPTPANVFVPTPSPDQDGVAIATPDRDDEQLADGEQPPMPTAPVMNPYPGAAGANTGAGAGGPYGGNAAAAAAGGVNVETNPPETQFDYANPQKYFERMRALQQQQQQQAPGAAPGMVPPGGLPAATTARPGPSAVPTAPGATLNQPGISPTPQQQPPAGQGQFFNPYNLPADYVPPPATPPTGPPVEPDRAKYANPYVPQTRPPD